MAYRSSKIGDSQESGDDAARGGEAAAGVDAVAGEETVAEAGNDLQAELSAERDMNLRLRAELENVRSRLAREMSEQARYAALPLARDLLPVVDNADRAIEHAEKDSAAGALLEGFRLVRQQLLSILQQHQCTEIAAQGEPFDPQMHEAIQQMPSAEAPAGHVAMVTQKGYRMHDRVVRPAQVIVSTGPAADAKDAAFEDQ